MPIVLITESLLLKSSARDGRVLRDRMLSGFCVRMNARSRTFRVAVLCGHLHDQGEMTVGNVVLPMSAQRSFLHHPRY